MAVERILISAWKWITDRQSVKCPTRTWKKRMRELKRKWSMPWNLLTDSLNIRPTKKWGDDTDASALLLRQVKHYTLKERKSLRKHLVAHCKHISPLKKIGNIAITEHEVFDGVLTDEALYLCPLARTVIPENKKVSVIVLHRDLHRTSPLID